MTRDTALASAMIERDDVLATVRGLLADARAGRGSVLFVVGEAGLGKTTVLDYVLAAARPEFAAGAGQADAAEAALPFGLIGQALEAAAGNPWPPSAPSGPPPGADLAIRAPRPADYCYAALAALRRVASARPVFLALDDAHWADPDSLTLLRLISRRITRLPVAILVTTRPWPPATLRAGEELAAQGLAAVTCLQPLSDRAARQILTRPGGTAGKTKAGMTKAGKTEAGKTEAEIERATALCGGNPLLLAHVAAALRAGRGIAMPDETDDTNATDATNTTREAGQAAWARTLLLSHTSGLRDESLTCLRAAAVLGGQFRLAIAGEVAGLTAPRAAATLEQIAAAGLVRVTADGLAEFSHELIRQAVYEEAAPARPFLHERAFRVLAANGATAEAARHAIAARLGGDPQAVNVLAAAGREALSSGAVRQAVRYLGWSVDFAGPGAAARTVFDLGRALVAAGDHEAGVARHEELLARADLPGGMRVAVLIDVFQTRLSLGQVAAAEAAIEEALRLAGPDERDLAAGAMADHAAQVLVTYGWERAAPLAIRARELAVSEPVRAAAVAVWGTGAYFAGDPAGLDAAGAAARAAAAGPEWRPGGAPWWDTVCQYATLALSAERFAEAGTLLDGVIGAARRRCDPMGVAIAMMFRARVSWRQGRLAEALALAERLCAEYTDLVPVITSMAAAVHALVLLDLGRLDEAGRWCERAAATAGDIGYIRGFACLPGGILALRRGDPGEACEVFGSLGELTRALRVLDPGTVPWAGDAVTAYLDCGHNADARRLIDDITPVANALPSRWPKAVVAAGEAALAERSGDPARALARYADALAFMRQAGIPLAEAGLLTDYGAFLRRRGDIRGARRSLAEAFEISERFGGDWHAARARRAWRSAGGRSRATPPGQLTPQEAAVARLAKAGKTNKEIAAQLQLTVNTVETHLRHVYQKLGIRRRMELIRSLGE